MRRRLVTSTVLIALLAVGVLGVPLVVLAREEVTASARDDLEQRARIVAAGIEDRVDVGATIPAELLLKLAPGRRVTVSVQGRPVIVAGPIPSPPVDRADASVAGATVLIAQPRTPTLDRQTNATLVVIAIGLLAIGAAVALSLRQSRQLATPLSTLAERAGSLGRGNHIEPAVRSGIPEIDEISDVLEASDRRIGRLVEMQQDFAADAAHQLRTPLTGVGLRLEEIIYLSDGDVRAEAEAALTQVERLDRVVTVLLSRARDDSAPPTTIDLADLAREECAAWERVLTARGRELRLDLAPGVDVCARRTHLATVMTTLLDNALQHGDGAVRVTVERLHRIDGGAEARLCVQDEGSGIAPELRERVFDRTVSGGRGTGIGLALARSLAEAEGARLVVAEPGNRFVLAMPPLH